MQLCWLQFAFWQCADMLHVWFGKHTGPSVTFEPSTTIVFYIFYCHVLLSLIPHADDGDGATLVTNSNIIDHEDFRGNPANSGTSKEQSDDDGDLEENTDPANTKKMRRMLSNRESARRSRKRKQVHLTDLESQVSKLTSENASLLKRLADMTQKYKDATLDNRNLTVDVETMRRKVNIAEEAVRRLTGTTLLLSTTCDKTASSMRLTSCPSDAEILLTSGEMGTKPDSLQRVASLEDLQKRIHRDSIHSEIASTFSDPEALANG
ncbi:hypothetical protein GQ55_3G463800 [Panicum hallii var. hallii]|uniref:BZIP domain-containing protein n=1 Tax=Panicum hallii var. hallii TaxID=1504633 RepID=A0A2T7EJ03_9POAL|nr:hypothetical protein GQ55_3G463800 [Panicum hallii var. hallii]